MSEFYAVICECAIGLFDSDPLIEDDERCSDCKAALEVRTYSSGSLRVDDDTAGMASVGVWDRKDRLIAPFTKAGNDDVDRRSAAVEKRQQG